MGWNQGYTIVESQVVSLYDLGVLNSKEILKTLLEPFNDQDVDSGGSNDLRAKDGKSLEDIICFFMEPEKYQAVLDAVGADADEYERNIAVYELYSDIAHREWRFW